MPENETPGQPHTAEIKERFDVVESPGGVQYIYSNHVSADWNQSDLHLRFAELTIQPLYKFTGERVTRIEDKVSVGMSWSKTKEVYEMLGRVLTAFEAKNGPIKVPNVP